MADLLGSILGTMEKPPLVSAEEAKAAKEQKAKLEEMKEKEREQINTYRVKTQKHIEAFVKSNHHKLTFPTMPKVFRAVVHEVAEVAGLAAYSFGEEEVDRHIILWKKEHTPCDAELNALRRGETWDPSQAASQETESLKSQRKSSVTDASAGGDKTARKYMDKYQAIFSREASKRAAEPSNIPHRYGMVPSANKLDQRTIEEVLAENRKKKRQKLELQERDSQGEGEWGGGTEPVKEGGESIATKSS